MQASTLVKKPSNVKIFNEQPVNKARTQSLGNRLNQLFNSKNSMENTDTDQIDGLKFMKNRMSIDSSQKSSEQITCRICLSEIDHAEEQANPIISP